MKENVLIREYKKEDQPLVLNLLRLNTPAYFAPGEEKDFAHYLEQELEFYYVIEVNKIVVGCGGINFSGDLCTGKISWDILHPEFHGRGLGTALLQHRLQKLKAFKDLRRIVVRTSQLAYRFYEKSGFSLIEKKADYWAKGFDLYLMEYLTKKK
ncbi:MAG: GNAT family N-acetyltransferase [Bacteroidota bacterium]